MKEKRKKTGVKGEEGLTELRERIRAFGDKLLSLFNLTSADLAPGASAGEKLTERQMREMLVLLEEKRQEYADKLSLIPMVELIRLLDTSVTDDGRLGDYIFQALGLRTGKPRTFLKRLIKDQLIAIILVAEEIPLAYTEDLFDEYKFSNRPSFRVFKFSSPGEKLPVDFKERFLQEVETINAKKGEVHRIHTKGYKFISLEEIQKPTEIQEIRLTYQYRIDYISPDDGETACVYGLAYSFMWLDLRSGMAVINAKHEAAIRDMQQMLRAGMRQVIQDIRFTESLIERIAKMDYIRRANLVNANRNSIHDPTYISISHPGLVHLPQFNELLQRANYELVSGYYKIPLEEEDGEESVIGDLGLGVSARRGKLWFPNHLSAKFIRRWGVGILRKISAEIEEIRNKNFAQYADIVNLNTNPVSATIHMESRREVMNKLVKNIFNIAYQQKEHEYLRETNALELVGRGKGYFFPPRLRVTCECGEGAFIPCPRCGNTDYKAKGGVIYCRECDQPMADELVAGFACPACGRTGLVRSVGEALYLYPNGRAYDYIWQQFEHMQSLDSALTYDQDTVFYIWGNQVWQRHSPQDILVPATALNHFRRLVPYEKISREEREGTLAMLKVARGKCPFAQNVDDCINCQRPATRENCMQWLLVEMTKSSLIPHAELGLGDLAFRAVLAREDVTVVAYGRNGRRGREEFGLLTSESIEGSKLLAQVLDDHLSSRFDLIGFFTRTDLAEDFLADLTLAARYGGKRLVIFDRPLLVRLRHECLLQEDFAGEREAAQGAS